MHCDHPKGNINTKLMYIIGLAGCKFNCRRGLFYARIKRWMFQPLRDDLADVDNAGSIRPPVLQARVDVGDEAAALAGVAGTAGQHPADAEHVANLQCLIFGLSGIVFWEATHTPPFRIIMVGFQKIKF